MRRVACCKKTISALETIPERSSIESLFKLISALDLEMVLQPKSKNQRINPSRESGGVESPCRRIKALIAEFSCYRFNLRLGAIKPSAFDEIKALCNITDSRNAFAKGSVCLHLRDERFCLI